MTDKLILKTEKDGKATIPVYVDIKTHSKMVALKAETDISIRKLTEMMLNFALENIVIEGDNDENQKSH